MDAKVLDILENCFEWNRDRKLIRKIRKEVEDFERWTEMKAAEMLRAKSCLLYTSPSPRD